MTDRVWPPMGVYICTGLLLLALIACSSSESTNMHTVQATPTSIAYLAGTLAQPLSTETEKGTPTAAPHFVEKTPRPTRTPRPTPIILPTAPITQTPETANISETKTYQPVYVDEITAGWTITNSWDVDLDLNANSYTHDGISAIAVTPLDDYGAVFFTLLPTATQAYPYTTTLGVRFWLNPGSGSIGPEDLTVTVLGSNRLSYWQEDDDSVQSSAEDANFSETRLSFLDVNTAIPPETWVEIEVWLDDLIYDPVYQYVTGLYIKSDIGFRQTFYIDNVALITVEE